MFEVKKDSGKSAYQQLADWLIDEIKAGRLQIGQRIPSTDQLSEDLGVGRKVVQQALEVLGQRGYLERKPGRGSVVTGIHLADCIGLVFPEDAMWESTQSFMRLTIHEVYSILQDQGFKPIIYLMKAGNNQEVKERIQQDIQGGRLLAVMMLFKTLNIDTHIPVLHKSPGIGQDGREGMVFRALQYLSARDCRRITIFSQGTKIRDSYQKEIDLFRKDTSLSCEINLQFGSNSKSQSQISEVPQKLFTEGGFKPDGILVTDDNLTRNFIIGLLNEGIQYPRDVKLVSHANKNSPILSPVPLTLFEFNPRVHAENYVKSLHAMMNGKEAVIDPVIPKLIIGKSCGE
ncbi:MAG: GntR family transcriptional regulator [Lentisphaeria bacterium]|nr:GntR family transcriptional regulator [Lentisphaeria bacterium]